MSSPVSLLEPWARAMSREEIVEIGQSWRLPILPVMTRDESTRAPADSVESPFRITDVSPASAARSEIARSSRRPHTRTAARGYTGTRSGHGLVRTVLRATPSWPWRGGCEVEGPQRRDGTRPAEDWHGFSGFFADLNRGKKSLVLDLATDEGRSVFVDLARER